MGWNPLKWARPIQITVGLAVALLLFVTLTSGISIAWARHIKNAALRGIASQISDIDATEGKADGLEKAVGALAEENKALTAKAEAEHAARMEMAARLAQSEKTNAGLLEAVKIAKAKDDNRKPITTLSEAVAVFNRVTK